MESCSHTEYRQSFYLTLHSEGLLFRGPPYLILLLPPRLPLLLVHRPLPENLAVERRRRVKTEASGYHESVQGMRRHSRRLPSRLSMPLTEPSPRAHCQWSLLAQRCLKSPWQRGMCWWCLATAQRLHPCALDRLGSDGFPKQQGILLFAYLHVIITC